jgi:hypothetical protein
VSVVDQINVTGIDTTTQQVVYFIGDVGSDAISNNTFGITVQDVGTIVFKGNYALDRQLEIINAVDVVVPTGSLRVQGTTDISAKGTVFMNLTDHQFLSTTQINAGDDLLLRSVDVTGNAIFSANRSIELTNQAMVRVKGNATLISGNAIDIAHESIDQFSVDGFLTFRLEVKLETNAVVTTNHPIEDFQIAHPFSGDVDVVVSTIDTFPNRSNAVPQQNEQVKIQFFDGANLVLETGFTDDVPDLVDFGQTINDFGTITLSDSIDHVRVVHSTAPNSGYPGLTDGSLNSVRGVEILISAEIVIAPPRVDPHLPVFTTSIPGQQSLVPTRLELPTPMVQTPTRPVTPHGNAEPFDDVRPFTVVAIDKIEYGQIISNEATIWKDEVKLKVEMEWVSGTKDSTRDGIQLARERLEQDNDRWDAGFYKIRVTYIDGSIDELLFTKNAGVLEQFTIEDPQIESQENDSSIPEDDSSSLKLESETRAAAWSAWSHRQTSVESSQLNVGDLRAVKEHSPQSLENETAQVTETVAHGALASVAVGRFRPNEIASFMKSIDNNEYFSLTRRRLRRIKPK